MDSERNRVELSAHGLRKNQIFNSIIYNLPNPSNKNSLLIYSGAADMHKMHNEDWCPAFSAVPWKTNLG